MRGLITSQRITELTIAILMELALSHNAPQGCDKLPPTLAPIHSIFTASTREKAEGDIDVEPSAIRGSECAGITQMPRPSAGTFLVPHALRSRVPSPSTPDQLIPGDRRLEPRRVESSLD